VRDVVGGRIWGVALVALLLTVPQVLATPSALAASSATVHLRFTKTVRGAMTKSTVAPRCLRDSSGTRIINLSGKIGSNEYVVMIYARGPQTVGQFPIQPDPQNAAAVTVQKVGTASSPEATFYVATGGSVALRTATAGSLTADLLTGGQDRLPLHVSGTWRCSAVRQPKS
jgi:hypothetical protein